MKCPYCTVEVPLPSGAECFPPHDSPALVALGLESCPGSFAPLQQVKALTSYKAGQGIDVNNDGEIDATTENPSEELGEGV